MYFKLLWREFATLPEVEAIALGGSRAGARPAGCTASKTIEKKGCKVLLVEEFKMKNLYFPQTILMIFSFI